MFNSCVNAPMIRVEIYELEHSPAVAFAASYLAT